MSDMNIIPNTSLPQSDVRSGFKITTDFQLWQYLFSKDMPEIKPLGKKPSKLTKAQAFYDLLSRYNLSLLTGSENIKKMTFQSLSEAWRWHRNSVSIFLRELEQMGVITIMDSDNSKVIVLNDTTRKTLSSGV